MPTEEEIRHLVQMSTKRLSEKNGPKGHGHRVSSHHPAE